MAILYGEDLAAIQVAGFGDHVRASTPALLAQLAAAGLQGGRVFDLGCGSGDWLLTLGAAGYDAVGRDSSAALVSHARRAGAAAQLGGIDDADLSGAVAVTALGEVFNYRLPSGRTPTLATRFRRIARALPPGGLLLFDLIVAGRPSLARRGWTEGEGWFVAVDVEDDGVRATRRIACFRSVDGVWRRTDEVHRLRVPTRAEVVEALRDAGFAVRTSRSWGSHGLLPRRMAVIARRRGRGG